MKNASFFSRMRSLNKWNDNVVNIKGLRKPSAPYIFIWVVYYAWVVVFTTWWTASPHMDTMFHTSMRSIIHMVNLVSSAALVFFMKKEWFVALSRIGAAMIIMSVAAYLLTKGLAMQLYAAIFMGVSLSCVNIAILMPFVFMMNNTEKFYSVLGSYVVINVISLFFEGGTFESDSEVWVALSVLAISLGTLWFFQRSHIPVNRVDSLAEKKTGDRLKVYLTTILSALVAILYKGAGKAMLNITAQGSSEPVLLWYCVGGLAGCLVYFAVYAYNKKSVYFILNIPFGCLAVGLLCNAFADQISVLGNVFALLLGVGSTIGMLNMYYMLGVIGKKYNSMYYVRWTLLIVGVCGGVSGILVGNYISNANILELSIATSIISVAAMIVFLILNPMLSKIIYVGNWDRDAEKMEITQDHIDILERIHLSKREQEVALLLLHGNTLRQIAGELGIAYNTVIFHTKALYRKLNINSRTELMMLFRDKISLSGDGKKK